jgi:cytochrome c oxidase subunit 2
MPKNLLSALRALVLTVLLSLPGLWNSAQAQPDGAAIYSANCAACHKIDADLVGPALKGISERRDEAWLIKWIKNSQAVINSGDPYAKDLYAKWNNVQMPAFDLSDDEVKAVLAYIKAEEGKLAAAAPAQAAGGDAAAAADPNALSATQKFFMVVLMFVLLFASFLYAIKTISTFFKTKGIRILDWAAINGILFFVFLVVGLYLVYYQFAVYGKHTLPESASEHGVITDQMFMITLVITMIVFVATHILLFTFPYLYRTREGHKAYYYPDNHNLERLWTIVPAIVLTALVLYGTKVWRDITQLHPTENVNTIELFAYQFGWKARYTGADNTLGRFDYRLISQDNNLGIDKNDPKAQDDLYPMEIVLPVNKGVLFRFRARDVIHSAYMPHFRAQMNVVPGMPTQFYMVPTITTEQMRKKLNNMDFNYELACNKICGAAHFNMRMKIRVVEEAEYQQWLKEQKTYFKPAENLTAQLNVNN